MDDQYKSDIERGEELFREIETEVITIRKMMTGIERALEILEAKIEGLGPGEDRDFFQKHYNTIKEAYDSLSDPVSGVEGDIKRFFNN